MVLVCCPRTTLPTILPHPGPSCFALAQALALDPLHPGYALSLAHALELTHDLGGVVSSVAQFLHRVEAAGPTASSLALGGGTRWEVRCCPCVGTCVCVCVVRLCV